jgi:hypothetical protein
LPRSATPVRSASDGTLSRPTDWIGDSGITEFQDGGAGKLEGFFAAVAGDLSDRLVSGDSESEKVSFNFNQINKATGHRIKYAKVDAETGEEVSSDDIVKGFEVDTDTYVTVDKDELDNIALDSTRTIDVDEFVQNPRSTSSTWCGRTTSCPRARSASARGWATPARGAPRSGTRAKAEEGRIRPAWILMTIASKGKAKPVPKEIKRPTRQRKAGWCL